jgi:uncharacterized membrane protein
MAVENDEMTGLPIAALIGLGLLFFATPLIVLVLVLVVLSLRSRVHRLEARLAQFEQRAGTSAPGPAPARAPEPAAPRSPVVAPEPVAPAEAIGDLQGHPTTSTPVGASVDAERDDAVVAAAPAPSPSAPSRSTPAGVGQWEWRLGGTWLSRVGALLLILGVGFFLKHAFEHDWIGPRGRVIAGLAAGVVLMAGGVRLARRGPYQVPAQSLIALGMGVLYLALYAAHALYALVPATPVFVAMALVTGAGFATALSLDARALAGLATVGGLLTPVVLWTDTDPAAALFIYLFILDLGVVVAAFRRGWPGVALLAFAGTQALYWGWLDRWYEADRLPLALGWATAFFAVFAAAALTGPRLARPAGTVELARMLLVLAAPAVYFAAVRRILDDPGGRRLALLALGLAGLHWLGARLAAVSARGGARVAFCHRAVALAFLALAPAVTLGTHHLVVAWCVVGLVLLSGGFALGAPGLRGGGLAITALGWGRWLAAVETDPGRAGTFLLAHPALPATVALAVTAALGALLYRARERTATPLARGEWAVRPVLLLAAVGSVALLVTMELSQFRTLAIPPPYVPIIKSVVWMLAAMALLALTRGDATRILLVVTTMLLLALVGEAMGGAESWARIQASLRRLVWNPRFLAGCLLVVLAWLYGQVAGSLPYLGEQARRRLLALGSAGAALLLLWNLSVEIVLMPLPDTRFDPVKLRMATLSVLWALYAFTAMAWGLWRDQAALRVGAIVLFCVTVLKVLIVDLAGLDALYRILSVAVLGAVLLVASFLYARARRQAA